MSPRKNASSVICGSSETEYIDKLNEGATPSYIGAFPYDMARQACENSRNTIGIV